MPRSLGPWPVRAAWLLAVPALGSALGDGLDGRHAAVRGVVVAGAWSLWALVLVAALVPTTASLTVVRTGAAGALAAAVWTALAGAGGVAGAVAVGWAAVTVVVALAAPTTDAFVDGSSYGDERRFGLRTPVLVVLAAPVAWAAVAAGVVAGPLLAAAGRWAAAAVATAGGVAAGYAGFRALHQLSRRWLVFVPAGVVVHDPLVLAEPVLCRRVSIAHLRPATVGDLDVEGTVDLAGGAPGLTLALELRSPQEVAVLDRRRRATVVVAGRLLVCPGRPGAVLAEARARRLAP